MTTRELSGSPAMLPLYAKALGPALPVVGGLPGVRRTGDALPDLELVRRGVTTDPDRLAAYSTVCGFGVPRVLPATYPHILAFPLHLALMTDGAFPFAPMGIVHVENQITQHRPIGLDEALDLRVWAADLRPHARGRQFDLVSEASVGGEVVWRDVSTMLRRGRGESATAPASALADVVAPAGATRWRVAGDLGRRYSGVSGDRNPIHLYGVTAKALGFPRQIAHGMWSKARCLAELAPRLPDAYSVTVAFKKPVLLPGTVAFGAVSSGDGWLFGLGDADRDVPHLVGTAQPV
ncbi:MAG: MaoC family dehydratase [Nocardioidaceae bacterium]